MSPPAAATVLIVEDEVPIRNMMERILSAQPYTVISAGSGEEAIEKLGDQSLDLLVTDIKMRGMSGRELAEQLQQTRSGLAVLFVSGYTQEQVGFEEDENPAFLEKPFAPNELIARVSALLAK